MQTNPIALRRAALLTACAATAYLILRQIIAIHAGLDRPLDTDEVEHLHSGWLMHQGLRLYRDFAEGALPESRRCLDRIIASGRAIRTPVPDVWDLHPDRR
jgi:hypothetical protein